MREEQARMRDFKGRTAVITGAGSGIGAALAHLAAREGMNLVLADINLADLEAVAATIDSPAIALQRTDVADPEAVQALADLARSEEHTSELQSLMRISYAVFCLKKKNRK